MKYCQACGRFYRNESQQYCSNDGSLLHERADPEETLVRPDDKSSARRTFVSTQRKSSTWFSAILYAGAFILTVAIGATVGWFLYRFSHKAPLFSSSETPFVAANRTPAPSDNSAAEASTLPQARLRTGAETSTSQNLSGVWNFTNTVDKTSYRTFADLRVGYRLVITQNGANFTAEGEKTFENGLGLPARGRSTIRVTGAVDGNTVQARFIEQGERRASSGTFVWQVEPQGRQMKGSFVSTAANSSGRSIGIREQ